MYEDIKTMRENQDVLNDVVNGKRVDWRGRKMKTLTLAEVYRRLGLNKAYRVEECGTCLDFVKAGEQKKLVRANFCKVRLCPMCAWRRSMKVYAQVSKVMDCMDKDYDYRYIFLTLTVKNVPGELLPDELDKLFAGFNLLTKRKEFKALSHGWFRALEVTHNWESEEYHPHFHMVIAVNKSYFEDKSKYLNHAEWRELWRSCMGLEYEPQVNVKAFRYDKSIGKQSKAVSEVAKYTVKTGDYLDEKDVVGMDSAVAVLDTALHNRRLVAFGGVMRAVHKKLNLDDATEGDLVKTGDGDDDIRADLAEAIITYKWCLSSREYRLLKK